MRLSVIICTRDRASQLRRTLHSIAQCAPPPEDTWEVIVVNNGCSDLTPDVVAEFTQILPLRSVLEPKAGLSNARNSGARAARGTWLLWTDDDVTVSSGWLQVYDHAIRRFGSAQVLGGPIEVCFEGRPPKWLLQGKAEVRSAYAGLDPDDVADPFQAVGRVPYGANFAVRRSIVMDSPFDANLGRHPQWPLRGGEETTMIYHALTLGHGRWLREALVLHHIDQSRQTKHYVRTYYFKYGKTQQQESARHATKRRIFRDLVGAMLTASHSELQQFLQSVTGSDDRSAANLKEAGRHWGRAVGAKTALGL